MSVLLLELTLLFSSILSTTYPLFINTLITVTTLITHLQISPNKEPLQSAKLKEKRPESTITIVILG